MREIAVHTVTLAVDLLVCASHLSKPQPFIKRSLCSLSTDTLSGKKFPANPPQKSHQISNIQKLQKDLKVTSEEKKKIKRSF